MPSNPPAFEILIKAFNTHGVSFVVVGGMAMVLHGSNYSTVDSDFAVATDPESNQRIIHALAPLNPRPSHWPAGNQFVWDLTSIYGDVVSLATDAGDVDLLRTVPGVDSFEGLLKRSVERSVFGEVVRVAAIQDLISMKTAANRPKDRNHLIELKALADVSQD